MPQGQQYYQAGPQEGGVVGGGPPPRQAPGPPPTQGGFDTRSQFNQGGKGMVQDALDEMQRPPGDWRLTMPGLRQDEYGGEVGPEFKYDFGAPGGVYFRGKPPTQGDQTFNAGLGYDWDWGKIEVGGQGNWDPDPKANPGADPYGPFTGHQVDEMEKRHLHPNIDVAWTPELPPDWGNLDIGLRHVFDYGNTGDTQAYFEWGWP